MEKPVHWYDDWYATEALTGGVTAIGEPHYHQVNWNYLIQGNSAALLFDTGPGVRNIAPVVAALAHKPLTVLPSHMHFDHTGNLHRFSNIAIADLPILRACMRGDMLHASDDLFLGHYEDMLWKPVPVSQWLPIGRLIDLGGVTLEVIHTPGHSPDSISLWNREANILFAADFIYPGPLYAQVPGSDLEDYLASATCLLALIDTETHIYCAHGARDQRAPRMNRSDIVDLQSTLEGLKRSGQRPESTEINTKMTLLADDAAFASWQSR
jgi:hydroxyacylglutathione hydrolase